MDRPRLYRGLRITVSAVCLILCGLLVVLWVRSDRTIDSLHWNKTKYGWGIGVTSFDSRYELMFATYNEIWTNMEPGVTYKTESDTKWSWPTHPRFGFGTDSTKSGNHFLMLPHWFPILITAALAAAPWMKWRFSLRTLLIATTLIAVMLGLVVAF